MCALKTRKDMTPFKIKQYMHLCPTVAEIIVQDLGE
jgi:hypothetical protein